MLQLPRLKRRLRDEDQEAVVEAWWRQSAAEKSEVSVVQRLRRQLAGVTPMRVGDAVGPRRAARRPLQQAAKLGLVTSAEAHSRA